jgi:hypothetical protein
MLCPPDALEELGIFDGINEVIATTERDGISNAAPLGIIREGKSLTIRLFPGSHTYENILATRCLVANVTHDPWLFAETALEDLPEEAYSRRNGALILRDAEAWGLFRCQVLPTDIAVAEIEFVKGEVLRRDFRAFNRGACLVVEAAIAATRYLALGTDSYYEEIIRLGRIVDRCGGPRERQAMSWLMERLDSYLHI